MIIVEQDDQKVSLLYHSYTLLSKPPDAWFLHRGYWHGDSTITIVPPYNEDQMPSRMSRRNLRRFFIISTPPTCSKKRTRGTLIVQTSTTKGDLRYARRESSPPSPPGRCGPKGRPRTLGPRWPLRSPAGLIQSFSPPHQAAAGQSVSPTRPGPRPAPIPAGKSVVPQSQPRGPQRPAPAALSRPRPRGPGGLCPPPPPRASYARFRPPRARTSSTRSCGPLRPLPAQRDSPLKLSPCGSPPLNLSQTFGCFN